MTWLNFNKKEEEIGGDYWKFVSASIDDIDAANIPLDEMDKVIPQISNDELREKMKDKLFSIIKEKGVFYNGIDFCLNLFSSEKVRYILETDKFNDKINGYLANSDEAKYHINDIGNFIYLFKYSNDNDWEFSMIKKILDKVKDNQIKYILVNLIEGQRNNKEIYDRLIKEYDSYLPLEYKNYLIMKNDHNYIYRKSLEFMDYDFNLDIDPRISIGPEIEANNDYDIVINITDQNGYENYKINSEATVPNGNEVAPIRPFHNTREDLAKFCGLCESMSDMGYYYDEISGNASGQINLGLDYLDSKEAILNFYEIYGNCEELLFYISSEEGQLFRQDVYINSRIKAISEIIGKRIVDEDLSREGVIKLFNSKSGNNDDSINGLLYKKNSVCLRGRDEQDYRLEIRIPNGGCNYKTWIDNIRLYGKIMEIAKKLADMMRKDYLTDEEEKLLKLKIDLQDDSLSMEEKLVKLMNLLFKEEDIRRIYYNRYISVVKRIKNEGTRKYSDSIYRMDPAFDEVEFVGKYKSRLDDYDGDGVITYDPEIGIIDNTRRR